MSTVYVGSASTTAWMFPVPARLGGGDPAAIEVKELWQNLSSDGVTQE